MNPEHIQAQIKTMVSAIAPHISPARLERIQRRIAAWQKKAEIIKQSEPKKPLPPLVKKSQGLPRALDPFYFRLVDNINTIE